jgi:nucleotide-binding universal stress UspA family protein
MKRILVPTDFSFCANKALDYAVCLAKKADIEIILLHACELIHNSFKDRKELIEEYNRSIQKAANKQLKILKKSIEDTEKIEVSTQLYDGAVIPSILQATESIQTELIVMGTLGRTGLRNKIVGSRTAELLAKSKVPVIAIPYDYEWSEPKRILLALNDPADKIDVLQPVFDIAELFESDVKVAVFSGIREEGVEVMEHSRNIHIIQETLQKKYIKTIVNTVHLAGRDFEDAMQEYINTNHINLLAMITHKRDGLDSLFHPSLTRKMHYHTTIPLLSIHSPS